MVGIRNQFLFKEDALDETFTLEKAARVAKESKTVRKQQPQQREGDNKKVEVIRRNPHRHRTSVFKTDQRESLQETDLPMG